MTRENRNSAIAAAILLLAFGTVGYYLPAIMVAAGKISSVIGGLVAAFFVLAFFGVFWLRGRSQQRKRGD